MQSNFFIIIWRMLDQNISSPEIRPVYPFPEYTHPDFLSWIRVDLNYDWLFYLKIQDKKIWKIFKSEYRMISKNTDRKFRK